MLKIVFACFWPGGFSFSFPARPLLEPFRAFLWKAQENVSEKEKPVTMAVNGFKCEARKNKRKTLMIQGCAYMAASFFHAIRRARQAEKGRACGKNHPAGGGGIRGRCGVT